MSNVKIIDNLRLHSYAGSLSSEVAKRDRPRQPVVYKPVPVQRPTAYVQIPSPTLNTTGERAILLAKAYSDFFHDPMEALSAENMVAGMASMLTNVLDPAQVLKDGQLMSAFANAEITLRPAEYNTRAQIEELLNDPKVQEFFQMFTEPAIDIYRDHRDQQLVCMGIIFLTLGKNVNPQNYDGWVKNRIRTFVGALGIPPDRCCWTESQIPSQEALATCYSFLSASFELRRYMFLICVAAARSTERISALFREIVMFLQGVEMGHIIMIDRYLFSKYPELLRIRSLRDTMEAINNAWVYLASLDPGERFFAKILYNRDQTAPLNRNHFQLLATAAIAAAQFETPSMRFYQGGNVTGASGSLSEIVRQYLNFRMNLAYYSIIAQREGVHCWMFTLSDPKVRSPLAV
jgi:hypothetical protein